MCAADDAEGFAVSSSVKRKARREHKCTECNRMIAAGETYTYGTGLYEGHWSSWKRCEQCDIAGSWLRDMCGGFLIDGIYEDLNEHWVEGYHSLTLGRLIVGMQRDWRVRRVPTRDEVKLDVDRHLGKLAA